MYFNEPISLLQIFADEVAQRNQNGTLKKLLYSSNIMTRKLFSTRSSTAF